MEEFFPATFRMDVRDEREAFFSQQEGKTQRSTLQLLWYHAPYPCHIIPSSSSCDLNLAQQNINSIRWLRRTWVKIPHIVDCFFQSFSSVGKQCTGEASTTQCYYRNQPAEGREETSINTHNPLQLNTVDCISLRLPFYSYLSDLIKNMIDTCPTQSQQIHKQTNKQMALFKKGSIDLLIDCFLCSALRLPRQWRTYHKYNTFIKLLLTNEKMTPLVSYYCKTTGSVKPFRYMIKHTTEHNTLQNTTHRNITQP